MTRIKIIGALLIVLAMFGVYKEGYTIGGVNKQKEMQELLYLTHLEMNNKANEIKEIVYQKVIESQIVYRDKVKLVKEYIHDKKDYTDTVCIPRAGLYGYNSSRNRDAESTTDFIRAVHTTESDTDTSEQ